MNIGYDEMLAFVQQVWPDWRVTRQRNLAWVVLGMLQITDAHLTVAEIARGLTNPSKPWHKYKRIWRFLTNLGWFGIQGFEALVAFVLRRYRFRRYVLVAFDQSTLAGEWEVLWGSLPFRGRALPIFFHLFTYADMAHDPEGSQNALEEECLRELVTLWPAGTPLVLLLDRGYARLPMLKLLDQLGTYYVLRTRKDAWVRYRRFAGPLQNVPIQRGQMLWWPRAAYLAKERYPVNLAITWNDTAEKPWYLLTNLPRASLAVRAYEQRFHCEELFRDLKDQLHLETIRTHKAVCVDHLLFSMVVAYHALTLLGAAAHKLGLHLKVCKDRVSLVWLSFRILKAALLRPQQIHDALQIHTWRLRTESG